MARIPTNVGGATPEMRRQLAEQARQRAAAAAAKKADIAGQSLGPLGPSGSIPAGVPTGAPQGAPVQAESSAGFTDVGIPETTVPA